MGKGGSKSLWGHHHELISDKRSLRCLSLCGSLEICWFWDYVMLNPGEWARRTSLHDGMLLPDQESLARVSQGPLSRTGTSSAVVSSEQVGAHRQSWMTSDVLLQVPAWKWRMWHSGGCFCHCWEGKGGFSPIDVPMPCIKCDIRSLLHVSSDIRVGTRKTKEQFCSLFCGTYLWLLRIL